MTVGLLALATMVASAQVNIVTPINVRGNFNGWGETPMNDDGDGTFSLTISGGTAGADVIWKIAQDGWTFNWPPTDAKSVYDAGGNFTFHFRPGPVADGWNPGADRVGYSDPGAFGWDIMGSFNGWSTPILTLTPQGNGVYSGSYLVASPGTYDFKFRKAGDWGTSIGADFGNGAANAQLTTVAPNELVTFQLDLPNGRWTTVVPEPALGALLGVGATLILRRFLHRR
jgi:hypothetical protein